MDWIAKVPWPDILREAASSTLGIVALVTIVLGIVVAILFKGDDSPKARLLAVFLIIVGVVAVSLAVQRETSAELARVEALEASEAERKRQQAALAQCRSQGIFVEHDRPEHRFFEG